jgi:hypothetical protein
MAALTCPNCGTQLAEGARFCPACGTPLTDTPPLASRDTNAAPPRSRWRIVWWVLGGVGCLGAGLVAACAIIGVLTLLGSRVSTSDTPVRPSSASGGSVPDNAPPTSGEVLVDDDFSSASTSDLASADGETSRLAYEGGAYVIEVKRPQTLAWALAGGTYKDVSVQVDAVIEPGSASVAAGLIFQYRANYDFYLYSVTNDGYYTLKSMKDGSWFPLIDSTQSDKIRAGRNTLRVETSGDRIALYVNDALLEETTDGALSAGEVGLAASTFTTSTGAGTGTISFDNLLIKRH